ncbi:hypothetical protein OTB20_12480 [Streptomyces sp. H27-H1]|uniref:hypothetical protein n=1 Tax=Streptomyces sp. H34-S4 TaxID=2996463 RepID=UPI00226F8333|nr:hypothetical protein [Streptomyces sp. H34-S4]MCY0927004.1 hypothetical protein [Streptomyces sp. H27-H1]MCY0933268.1 hypothetical protein [Streptomyces sp. H34-S4]
MLGLVQERELVGYCPESGCRLAGRPYGGGEAGDAPRTVGLLVLVDDTEEDLVTQTTDQRAEFGDVPGDGDAVRRAVGVSGYRELAALGIEG